MATSENYINSIKNSLEDLQRQLDEEKQKAFQK